MRFATLVKRYTLNNCVGGGGVGFHATKSVQYTGAWEWNIAVKDGCDYYGCDCDLTITLLSYNGSLYFYEETGTCL